MVYNLQSDKNKAERYFNSKSRIEYHSSLSINLYLLDFELNASPLVWVNIGLLNFMLIWHYIYIYMMNIELHSVYNLYLHTQLVLYLKIHNSFQMLMYCLHSPVSLVFFLQPAKRNKTYDYVLKHLQFNNHDWHEWFHNWCKWLDNNKWGKQCTVKEFFIVERMLLKLHMCPITWYFGALFTVG